MRLDHVNIRTRDLERLIAFYRDAVGLEPGPRPPFPFPGAWLYADGEAVVHLIGLPPTPQAPSPAGAGQSAAASQEDLRLEHFALASSGLAPFLARLEALGIDPRLARVPGGGSLQVNLWDPDGNHLHVDFPAAEAEALGL